MSHSTRVGQKMSLIGSLLSRRPRAATSVKPVETVADGQPSNPFDEFCVLPDHSCIVRHILWIDDTRVATASDDRTVIIWDLVEQRGMQILKGHTLPVTCLLWATQGGCGRLLTGSADRSIMVWNVETGVPSACWNAHGAVNVLNYIGNGTICSGGKDLCVWHVETNALVYRFKRDDEDSDVQRVLVLSGHRIIASAESQLVVYRINNLDDLDAVQMVELRRIDRHRESIRACLNVSPSMFVTGSLDGVVKLWASASLLEVQVFNYHESYQSSDHKYNHSVQEIILFRGTWIAVAIGNGFAVYDTAVASGEARVTDAMKHKHVGRLASVQNAHHATVTKIFALEDDLCIVTGSADASIRIWDLGKLGADPTPKSTVPVLIGELLIHSNCINDLVPVGRAGFVSCGSDGLVISWKNGMIEAQRRSDIALQMLHEADEARRAGRPCMDESCRV